MNPPTRAEFLTANALHPPSPNYGNNTPETRMTFVRRQGIALRDPLAEE